MLVALELTSGQYLIINGLIIRKGFEATAFHTLAELPVVVFCTHR